MRETLCLTLKDDTTENKRTENERQNANASAKSKELHPNAQSRHNAAHLLLLQRTDKNLSTLIKNQYLCTECNLDESKSNK